MHLELIDVDYIIAKVADIDLTSEEVASNFQEAIETKIANILGVSVDKVLIRSLAQLDDDDHSTALELMNRDRQLNIDVEINHLDVQYLLLNKTKYYA